MECADAGGGRQGCRSDMTGIRRLFQLLLQLIQEPVNREYNDIREVANDVQGEP